jgi:hypothetical protein
VIRLDRPVAGLTILQLYSTLPRKNLLLLDIVKIALEIYKELLQEKNANNKKEALNPPHPLLWTMSKSKQICSRDRFP